MDSKNPLVNLHTTDLPTDFGCFEGICPIGNFDFFCSDGYQELGLVFYSSLIHG